MKYIILSALFLLISTSSYGVEPSLEPNPSLTPGAYNENATVAEICQDHYTDGRDDDGEKVRRITSKMKKEIFAAYGLTGHEKDYVLDHFLELENGGKTTIENIWPQPKHALYNDKLKNRLENAAHKLICNHNVELHDYQKFLLTNGWLKSYEKYIGPLPQN